MKEQQEARAQVLQESDRHASEKREDRIMIITFYLINSIGEDGTQEV